MSRKLKVLFSILIMIETVAMVVLGIMVFRKYSSNSNSQNNSQRAKITFETNDERDDTRDVRETVDEDNSLIGNESDTEMPPERIEEITTESKNLEATGTMKIQGDSDNKEEDRRSEIERAAVNNDKAPAIEGKSQEAKQALDSVVSEIQQKRDEQSNLKNAIYDWVVNVSENLNEEDYIGSVRQFFVEGTSEDEIYNALNMIFSAAEFSTIDIQICSNEGDNVVAIIYGFDGENLSSCKGGAFGFQMINGSPVYSGAVLNSKACGTCHGNGYIQTGTMTCAICGGTGQQYIPNAYYDTVMGWQGMYVACGGCGGMGYTYTYDYCSECNGWGVIP